MCGVDEDGNVNEQEPHHPLEDKLVAHALEISLSFNSLEDSQPHEKDLQRLEKAQCSNQAYLQTVAVPAYFKRGDGHGVANAQRKVVAGDDEAIP